MAPGRLVEVKPAHQPRQPQPRAPWRHYVRLGWARESNCSQPLSGRYDLGFVRLELDGTYIKGTTSIDSGYNAVAQDMTSPLPELAGPRMPDQDESPSIAR